MAAVGFVDNPDGDYSRLQNLTIEEYRARQLAARAGGSGVACEGSKPRPDEVQRGIAGHEPADVLQVLRRRWRTGTWLTEMASSNDGNRWPYRCADRPRPHWPTVTTTC